MKPLADVHRHGCRGRFLDQLLQQEVGTFRALGADDGVQRLQPFTGLLGVGVDRKSVV